MGSMTGSTTGAKTTNSKTGGMTDNATGVITSNMKSGSTDRKKSTMTD